MHQIRNKGIYCEEHEPVITFVRKIYNIQQYPDNSLKSFDASGSEYTAKKVSSMEG